MPLYTYSTHCIQSTIEKKHRIRKHKKNGIHSPFFLFNFNRKIERENNLVYWVAVCSNFSNKKKNGKQKWRENEWMKKIHKI